MKETVEHNNRFYTNEKGEIKTENEQLKEWLLIANKENERLKEENTILKQTMSNNSLLINENALLKSIIKEVREYIEKLLREETEITDEDNIDYGMKCQRAYFSDSELCKVLEILDKE